MPEINDQVAASRRDPRELETLLMEMDPFILHSIFRLTHRFATVHDDEYSIALEAFVEAVQSFQPEKGSFLSFAYLVIRRRLIDYFKYQRHKNNEFLVEPSHFTGEKPDSQDDNQPSFLRFSVPAHVEDFTLKWEIDSLHDALKHQHISFQDLADSSPKSAKTKNACARIIVRILKDPNLIEQVKKHQNLPLKYLEEHLPIPRKTMEAHRKYIIAAVEIMTGDYPLLAEYLGPVKEEMRR